MSFPYRFLSIGFSHYGFYSPSSLMPDNFFYWMPDNENFILLNLGFAFYLNIFELYPGAQLSYLEGI